MLLLIFLSFSLFFFHRAQSTHIAKLSDDIIHEFRMALSHESEQLLSLSLALAENGELKEALRNEDDAQGHKILSNITQNFKKYTSVTSLRLQVLTPDFFIFARSWNQGFEGMPIWWFRDDLEKLTHNKQPKVGMEMGRLLTFKSTIPIKAHKKLIGYLEAIELIDKFSAKLRLKGIDLFALMDEKHLEKATLMRNFPRLFTKVIANQNYNMALLKDIQSIDPTKLFEKQFMMHEKKLFVWEEMRNGEGDLLGGYLLVLSEESIKNFQSQSKNFFLFSPFSSIDIKQAIKQQERNYGSFKSGYDRDLIGLLSRLREEDKKEFEAEAREVLNLYDKSELIDIILDNSYREKKRGVIK